jgi:hypothetical protein
MPTLCYELSPSANLARSRNPVNTKVSKMRRHCFATLASLPLLTVFAVGHAFVNQVTRATGGKKCDTACIRHGQLIDNRVGNWLTAGSFQDFAGGELNRDRRFVYEFLR